MSSIRLTRTISLIAAAAFITVSGLTACSSSGGDNGGGTAAPVKGMSIGTMKTGSVIVNGVRFEDTAADIIADDTPKVLGDGMTVKVEGTINDDRLNGTAESIEVDNEVRGAVTAKVGDTLTVLGQTILVDGGTFFANGAPTNDLAGIGVGDNVEVHGQRDTAGVIRATRVEELGAGAVDDEVRGTVAGKTASSFTIGALTITFDGTTVMDPAGATFADGDIVEVHLNGTFATQIHPEDDLLPGENEEFEVEGFISGFSDLNSTFEVNGQTVQVSSSTRFDGGLKSELANDIKVEAEGHLSGGILVARKIAFKETVRIESNATAVGSADLLGRTVEVTSKTEFQNLPGVGAIAIGDGLRIRGFVNNDGSITATRVIKQSNPVDPDKNILQGPVTTKNADKSLVILGITVSIAPGASSMDDSPDDNDVAFANIDAFLAAVTEGRTIVKAKGTFSGSTLAATELEIE